MGGPSQQQLSVESAQANFYNTLTSEYSSVYGENQSILQGLTASFEPILKAGINQQGFSPEELQSLNSTATNASGQSYGAAKTAVSNAEAAQGGGNTFVPSGAKTQLNQEVATSAAQNLSGQELGIQQQNYALGRQNYLEAAGILGGVASQDNPAQFANAATGAGSAAATSANEITQADNSWMTAVSGMVGAGLGAVGQYEGNK